MKPENNLLRKQMRLRFLMLYVTTICLMGIIFAALWPGKSNAEVVATNKPSLDKVNDQDKMLHEYFADLYSLDDASLNLLTDAQLANDRTLLNSKLATIDSNIIITEKKIGEAIDKLASYARKESGKQDRSVDSLVASYEMSLKNHRSLMSIRPLMTMTVNDEQNNNDLLIKSQKDLRNKDEQIARLEKQLRIAQQEARYNSLPTSPTIAMTAAGKSDDQAEAMLKENKALRQDNDRLILELGKMRKINEESIGEKQSELERRVNDLTSQLYLAQIDCNLTRADAKQVIYNSKQRKDLLSQALRLLNNLSGTADADLQSKLKQKTEQLKAISSTIRD